MGLPLGLLVAMSRFRLYDADSAIRRTVAYFLVTLTMIIIFGAMRGALIQIGDLYLGYHSGAPNNVWSAIVSIILLKPVQRRLTKWIDEHVRGGLLELRDDLPFIIGDLRETESAQTVTATILEMVEDGTRVMHGAIAFGGSIVSARNVDAKTCFRLVCWLDAARESAEEDGRLRPARHAIPVRRATESGRRARMAVGGAAAGLFDAQQRRARGAAQSCQADG